MLQFRAEGSGDKACFISVAMAISVVMAVNSGMCVMQCVSVSCDSAATADQDSADQELARSLQSAFDAQVGTNTATAGDAATTGDEAFARMLQQQWTGAARLRGHRSTNDAATPSSVVRTPASLPCSDTPTAGDAATAGDETFARMLQQQWTGAARLRGHRSTNDAATPSSVVRTPASLPCSDTPTALTDSDGSTAADDSYQPALAVLAELADLTGTTGTAGTNLPPFQTPSIQGGDSLSGDDTDNRTTQTQSKRQRGSHEIVDVGLPVGLDGDLLLPSHVQVNTDYSAAYSGLVF